MNHSKQGLLELKLQKSHAFNLGLLYRTNKDWNNADTVYIHCIGTGQNQENMSSKSSLGLKSIVKFKRFKMAKEGSFRTHVPLRINIFQYKSKPLKIFEPLTCLLGLIEFFQGTRRLTYYIGILFLMRNGIEKNESQNVSLKTVMIFTCLISHR